MAKDNDRTLLSPSCSARNLTTDRDIDRTPGVRLYRSSPNKLTMQIRSYGKTAHGSMRGAALHHVVSSAEIDHAAANAMIAVLQVFVKGGNF